MHYESLKPNVHSANKTMKSTNIKTTARKTTRKTRKTDKNEERQQKDRQERQQERQQQKHRRYISVSTNLAKWRPTDKLSKATDKRLHRNREEQFPESWRKFPKDVENSRTSSWSFWLELLLLLRLLPCPINLLCHRPELRLMLFDESMFWDFGSFLCILFGSRCQSRIVGRICWDLYLFWWQFVKGTITI